MKRVLLFLCLATSLGAQTSRDTLVTTLRNAKARSDSLAALSNPSLRQFCTSGFNGYGYMKNGACLWNAPLFARESTYIGSALARSLTLKPDTIVIHTKPETVYVQPPATPVVATVSVSVVSSLTVGQAAQATATARDANGAVITGRVVAWMAAPVTVATVSPAGLVTGVAAGASTVRAVVDTKFADAPVTVVAPPPPVDTTPIPPLPVDTSVKLPALLTTTVASTPSTGRTLTVTAGGNLQAAFDSSRFGDRIALTCGATYTGNFTLSAKAAGSGWITVQSTCTLPAEGTRVSPTQTFARISSPTILPAIYTIGGAQRWRFVGVEVTTTAATNQGLIALGCANQCETATAQQPSDIIFDRSYIHAPAATDVRRCFGFNGARLAVIDSYVSDCHSAFDAQAIAGWNGPGPFKIVNNYLEGAAENIAFGGGDPVVPNLIPSDIEIRRNHIAKPMSWKGGPWLIKNLVEFKIGRRVLIEANVIENNWPSAQQGFAFVLWSVNQQTTCTWCVTEHLTIRNNVIRNVSAGWSMVATGANGMTQYRAVPMNHVAIRNNVVIGLDNSAVGGYGRIFEISDTIQTLTIEHNTAFSPSNSSFIWGGALPLPNHIVKNNLVGGGQYQLFTTYGQGQIAWDHAGGPGSVFAGNVVAQFSGGTMVPGNYAVGMPWEWLGLVGGANPGWSPTATLNDLAFQPWSGYAKKGTDGRDPGADIPAVKAATDGVTAIGATVPPASTQRIQIRKP